MDEATRQSLDHFIRPLYQDLDGGTRFSDLERVARIARSLEPSTRELELLLLFHGLGSWLKRMGNLSRTLLAVGHLVTEAELRGVMDSAERLEGPVSRAERAVAAAILIDQSGLRGLAERLARARREGTTPLEVAREELMTSDTPLWLPAAAAIWLSSRRAARDRVCLQIVAEEALEDRPRS